MKKILFMSEEEARTTLNCAGMEGKYEFYVTGNRDKNKTIQFHPYCKKFINLENSLKLTDNTQPLVDELISIIKAEDIDILLPVSIACMSIVDRHKAEILEHVAITPFPTKENIDLLDDKNNFHKFCIDNDIAHPESRFHETSNTIDADNLGINYPVLIKPTLGAGGITTLVFAKNAIELKTFLEKPEDEREKYFPAIVQEFFEGMDIDFNGFSVNGKVLASSVMRTKFDRDDPDLYFTDFVKNDDVDKLGRKILNLSGYSGPTNIDMRIRDSDGKLMLIEVNPRYWARVHVSLMDGMNFLDVGISATDGKPYEALSQCRNKYWISSFSAFVKAILMQGKLGYIKYLFLLSGEQLRYMNFNRKFMAHAKKCLKSQS